MSKIIFSACLIIFICALVGSSKSNLADKLQENPTRTRHAGDLIGSARQGVTLGSGNGFANGTAVASGGSENAWSSTNGVSQGSVSLVQAGSATNAGMGPPFGAPPTAIGGGNAVIVGSGNGSAQAGALGSSGAVNTTTGGGGTASGTQ